MMAEETEDIQEQAQQDEEQAQVEATEQEESEGDGLPENEVVIEDAGACKKKVTVTVARERIDAKLDEMFGELAGSAQVPGFRIGRAPRRLVEKRFGKEVSHDVRNSLLGEALGGAIDKTGLRTIGEPDIELDEIELPDEGEMQFSFEVEVSPEFDLPELKGIKVNRPTVEIDDGRVDESMDTLRRERAKFEQHDGPAAEGDHITAGASITGDGIERVDRPGLELRVAPGQVEGIPLIDMGKELGGKKAGQTASLTVTVTDAHPNEQWRGKEVTVEIAISAVRRQILPELDGEFAEALGFDSLDELRSFVKERLESRVADEVSRAMRQQIQTHLLDNTEFELPEAVLERHAARLVQRQYVDLLQEGVPREQVDERAAELQTRAAERARQELKLQFILAEIARDKEIELSDDEVDTRIANLAATYNRRPERMRQELEQSGSLATMPAAISEEKVLDLLLADAEITEVAAQPDQEAEKATKKKAAKKTAKKTAKKAAKKTKDKDDKDK